MFDEPFPDNEYHSLLFTIFLSVTCDWMIFDTSLWPIKFTSWACLYSSSWMLTLERPNVGCESFIRILRILNCLFHFIHVCNIIWLLSIDNWTLVINNRTFCQLWGKISFGLLGVMFTWCICSGHVTNL